MSIIYIFQIRFLWYFLFTPVFIPPPLDSSSSMVLIYYEHYHDPPDILKRPLTWTPAAYPRVCAGAPGPCPAPPCSSSPPSASGSPSSPGSSHDLTFSLYPASPPSPCAASPSHRSLELTQPGKWFFIYERSQLMTLLWLRISCSCVSVSILSSMCLSMSMVLMWASFSPITWCYHHHQTLHCHDVYLFIYLQDWLLQVIQHLVLSSPPRLTRH